MREEQGIAHALHELIGWPVAIEDSYGNIRAWSGPGQVPPYPKRSAADQAQVLRRAAEAGGPIAVGDQLLAVASPRPDTLGVIVLVGPLSEVGDRAQVALEHGATVLAMELARLQSVADTELRLGRDLVEELLAHDDEAAAISRARAMGYDLDQRHQVAVVVEHPPQPRDPDDRFHAVRRAALAVNAGTLLVPRGDAVVVLGRDRPDWAAFHRQLLSELGQRACVGVGAPCDDLAGFPRSYHQARLALRMRDAGAASPVLFYKHLGSYRLLAEISDLGAIDRFVDESFSSLIAHDDRRNADLVPTLMAYLRCRGGYDSRRSRSVRPSQHAQVPAKEEIVGVLRAGCRGQRRADRSPSWQTAASIDRQALELPDWPRPWNPVEQMRKTVRKPAQLPPRSLFLSFR